MQSYILNCVAINQVIIIKCRNISDKFLNIANKIVLFKKLYDNIEKLNTLNNSINGLYD